MAAGESPEGVAAAAAAAPIGVRLALVARTGVRADLIGVTVPFPFDLAVVNGEAGDPMGWAG